MRERDAARRSANTSTSSASGGLPRPLPDPDHVGGLVHRVRPDPRLPDRLPAPLPRPPRAHRRRAGAPVAHDHGRLDDVRRADRRAPRAGRGPCRGRGRRRRPQRPTASPSGRRPERATGSTPSCSRHTPTTPCACCPTPTIRERDALGAFEYSTNRVVLHTDPRRPAAPPGAWASWNVDQADCRQPSDALTMTYHMNRLQALPGPVQYFVSVNPDDRLDRSRIIVERPMRHPLYTFETLDAQARVGRSRATGGPSSQVRTSATASTRTAVDPGTRPHRAAAAALRVAARAPQREEAA